EAVVAITARDPEDSRRRTATFLDLDEIAVFGDDYGISLASLLVDLRVLCPEEAQILYVSGLALSKISQPSGESGRKLGINPDWEGRSHGPMRPMSDDRGAVPRTAGKRRCRPVP